MSTEVKGNAVMPVCPHCLGAWLVQEASARYKYRGTYFCSGCNEWFNELTTDLADNAEESGNGSHPTVLAKKLEEATHQWREFEKEASIQRDGKESLEQVLVREYYYHTLRAAEIQDRLRQNGVLVGPEDVSLGPDE
jgi:hypothetical protein